MAEMNDDSRAIEDRVKRARAEVNEVLALSREPTVSWLQIRLSAEAAIRHLEHIQDLGYRRTRGEE